MTNFRKMLTGFRLIFRRLRQGRLFRKPFDRTLLAEPFRLLTHPVAVFNDIKYEDRGSLSAANLWMLLFVFEEALAASAGGYLFHPAAGRDFDLWSVLGRTAGPALMWTVCNWAMCTLTDGEGKMREIWIAVCYSLTPAILLGFVSFALSHMLSLDERMIYLTVGTAAKIWTLLLVLLGMMIVHGYTVAKTLGSAVLTLLCMAAAAFLFLLFFAVVRQMVGFVSALLLEISYR